MLCANYGPGIASARTTIRTLFSFQGPGGNRHRHRIARGEPPLGAQPGCEGSSLTLVLCHNRAAVSRAGERVFVIPASRGARRCWRGQGNRMKLAGLAGPALWEVAPGTGLPRSKHAAGVGTPALPAFAKATAGRQQEPRDAAFAHPQEHACLEFDFPLRYGQRASLADG